MNKKSKKEVVENKTPSKHYKKKRGISNLVLTTSMATNFNNSEKL
jgi:hypothetical protein